MSSRWPDKFVIGLTGNIATGKSVVRRMIEHLGAFGLDADGLAHRAMSPGAPAFKPIVQMFGRWILDDNNQINRARLGNVVFSDQYALSKLEEITHPVVGQAIDIYIKRASQKVVVLEAIKLIESGLADDCDSVWVVDCSESLQVKRLVEHRKLSEEAARLRVSAQSPQGEKLAKADVVIRNDGSYESTFNQIQKYFDQVVPEEMLEVEEEEVKEEVKPAAAKVEEKAVPSADDKPVSEDAEITIKRGGPKDAEAIAEFINKQTGSDLSRTDIMIQFGQKAYMLAKSGNRIIGLTGYLVENLIARIDELILAPDVPVKKTIDELMGETEKAANGLQAEITLVFLPNDVNDHLQQAVKAKGYEKQEIEQLKIPDWREAARESQPDNSFMVVKRLREDRVLRPM